MKRYLITTADERSWKFDCPVLFLGEWCRRYDRKHIWSVMDAIVAGPYGLGASQKLLDIDYVQTLASQILTELTDALNKFHQTGHSERYWNIVLGHWLQRYVAVAFNRYHALDQALKTYEIAGTTVFEAKDYSLATADSMSFIWACNDDQWNHVLYSRLMAYWGDVELNLAPSPLLGLKGFCREQKKQNGRLRKIKGLMSEFANSVGQKLARNTDAFIINSYLPIKGEIKLQLALGQMPQLWRSPSFARTLPDAELRASLVFNHDKYEGFEKYVLWQLPEIIPTCYLEGYKSLVKITEELPWPEHPKFIFTSNNFDTDEIFKVWTGSKVEDGVPYFTGQHGANYGTHVYFGNSNWPERASADRFFTWGWMGEGSWNNVPAFVFTTIADKTKKFDPKGGGVLIELHQPFMLGPADDYYEFGLYQEEQFRFVNALPVEIRRQLTVRLYVGYKDMAWFDIERWKDQCPDIQIEVGTTAIRKLTARNRLVIHSYDSTGILETLSLNIPTLCFWSGMGDHLLPSAKPYYELLRNAGILADTPEQAAEMLISHWDNISGWWDGKRVQDAREVFCERYARTEKYPVRVLKKLLLQR